MVDLTVARVPNFQRTPNAAPFTGMGLPTNARVIRDNLAALMQTGLVVFPRETPKYYTRLQCCEYQRGAVANQPGGPLTTVGNIVLPLSLQLVDAESVAYDIRALGTVTGMGTEFFMNSINSFARQRGVDDQQARQLFEGQQGIPEGFFSNPQNLGAFAPGPLGTAASAALGVSPNTFLTIVLEGPQYKTFEMAWKFSPNTPQEAEDLRRIIALIRRYKQPGVAAGGALWSFPHLWRIALMPNPKYMYKFRPAMITDMVVNYTPQGHPAFHRADPFLADEHGEALGTPACVDLQLKFLEIELPIFENHLDDFQQGRENNDPWRLSPTNGSPR